MRKTLMKISAVVLVLLLILPNCLAFAEGDDGNYASSIQTSAYLNGEYRSFIKNEYYARNYESFLSSAYDSYLSTMSRLDSLIPYYVPGESTSAVMELDQLFGGPEIKKMTNKAYEAVSKTEELNYLSIFLNYPEDSSKEKNTEILGSIDGITDILYVSDKTPCAVVGIYGKDLDVVLANDNVGYVNHAFYAVYSGWIGYGETYTVSFKPTTADARAILRYAAHIENKLTLKSLYPDSENDSRDVFIICDTDFDDRITVTDARNAMRIAAGLEKGNEYTFVY